MQIHVQKYDTATALATIKKWHASKIYFSAVESLLCVCIWTYSVFFVSRFIHDMTILLIALYHFNR